MTDVKAMTKTELVAAVTAQLKLDLDGRSVTKRAVERVVNEVLTQIRTAVLTGRDVRLPDFGSFELKQRAQRRRINPQTKLPYLAEAHTVPTFHAAPAWRTAARHLGI